MFDTYYPPCPIFFDTPPLSKKKDNQKIKNKSDIINGCSLRHFVEC